MSLYVGDYLQDTTKLSTEQHGAYLLILMEMWKAGGRIPDTEAELAASARLPVKRWRQIGGMVRALLMSTEDGFVTQKRLAKEIERVSRLSETRRAVSDLGVMARAIQKRRALEPIGAPKGLSIVPAGEPIGSPNGSPQVEPQVAPTLQIDISPLTPLGREPGGSLATALPTGALREPLLQGSKQQEGSAGDGPESPSARSLREFAERQARGRRR